MKIVYIILAVVAAVALAVVVLIQSWANTKYGRLDTRAAIFVKLVAISGAGAGDKSLTELRKVSNAGSLKITSVPEPFSNMKNITIPGPVEKIPIRIYTPEQSHNSPIILFFHGGGWATGSIDTVDSICRLIAKKGSAIVVSVEYRLAPENPFPAGLNDCYAALCWTYQNAQSIGGDPRRIAVAGNSAGANLATAVALMARDKNGPPIIAQSLMYPVTNSWSTDTESQAKFGKDFYLSTKQIESFNDGYVPRREDRKNPLVSPLLADNLKGLPPALVVTAEFDPLRDEGEAYVKRMREAGVPVVHTRYKGMIHGFVGMGRFLPQAGQAIDEMTGFLKKQFDAGEKVSTRLDQR